MLIDASERIAFEVEPHGTSKTPFERNLLPVFTRWFIEQVASEPPDFFVPVETKGARLLDAVLACAREELGQPIRIPVLYRPSLAYLDPAIADRTAVVILDDATRTGYTLAKHRTAVERWGRPMVRTLACLGDAGPDGNRRAALDQDVRCWRWLPTDAYREHLWQLAELVVSRGLPPEVDHNVFHLSSTSRLSRLWTDLAEAVAGYGDLTQDGANSHRAESVSMTLHWPALPGELRGAATGPTRAEGVRKIRMFADFARDTVHVVPMAFPAVDLPAADVEKLEQDCCLASVARWSDGPLHLAETLLARAHYRSPELLYRALSTAAEAELIVGFTRVVAQAAPHLAISVACDRDVFTRLYGPRVGAEVADDLDRRLNAAARCGEAKPRRRATAVRVPDGTAEDGRMVAGAARAIVQLLKRRFVTASERAGRSVRVGMTLSELRGELGLDELTASRAIDYALAATSLVPYTEAERVGDQVEVRRKYRASEPTRLSGTGHVEDLDSHKRQIDEEVVALIARTLRRRSKRWRGSDVPPFVISKVVAILEPVVINAQQLSLRTQPADFGPEVVLDDESGSTSLRNVVSEHFTADDRGFVESELFNERYANGQLRIQALDVTAAIESYIVALAPVLDEAENISDTLTQWGVLAGGRLGFDYVRFDLDKALRRLEPPLRTLARGDGPSSRRLRDSVREAAHLTGIARSKLRLLGMPLKPVVSAQWPDPLTVEQELLASLVEPASADALLGIGTALCDGVEELQALVARLSAFAAGAAQGTLLEPVNTPQDAAPAIIHAAASLEQRLLGLRDLGSMPHVPEEPRMRERAVSDRLLALVMTLRGFIAALAWSYIGAPSTRRRRPGTRRRTVLYCDLSRSTERGIALDQQANVRWKNAGLNLIAQWAHAFGGDETTERAGDDIVLEFEDADAAVLCAAAVQEHVMALRSTGASTLDWEFKLAIDTDELTDADGGNVIGACIDRSAKLCRQRRAEAGDTILITPETAQLVSAAIRPHLTDTGMEVDLVPGDDSPLPKARFAPLGIDRAALLRRYVERISAGPVSGPGT